MKISVIAILLLIAGIGWTGCSKEKLNENSPSLITGDNLFVNKEGFENALNGLYDEMRRIRSGSQYGSSNTLMQEAAVIGVDNAYGNWRAPVEDVFNLWGADNNAAEGYFSDVFAWLYETINAANTIVDRAQNPDLEWSEADKDEILAEARCIRAWCYRHLTYLWGDVPLTLHESSGSNIKTDWERTPVAVVRDSMEADWLFAEKYLPETSQNDGKLLKGVSQHYLAELYLAEGKPQQAKEMALKVTQNPAYALVTERYGVNKALPGTPFTDMFIHGNSNRSEGNTEALWVIQNEQNVIGGEGNNIMARYWLNRYYSLAVTGTDGKKTNPIAASGENGGRGIGRLGPTRFALDLYDSTDDRGSDFAWRHYWIINGKPPKGYAVGDTIFLHWDKDETLSNADWPNPRKWDFANPINDTDPRQYNDQVYLRAGETWLLLAEADYELGDAQGATDAINALRARAHAPAVTAGQVTLDLILDERSRELFSEEERRYTLRRTHSWLRRTKLYNKIAGPHVQPRDTLLPIPQDVIDANLTKPMPQNPGY
ncbi:RagB/SusD family nutrient uptake outer membrane protein [Compostibacter hankyongensis]